jgi:hypothetical protein
MSFGSSTPGGSPDGIGGNESGIGSSSASDGGGVQDALSDFFDTLTGGLINKTVETGARVFNAAVDYASNVVPQALGVGFARAMSWASTPIDALVPGADLDGYFKEMGADFGHTLITNTSRAAATLAGSLGVGGPTYDAATNRLTDTQGNVYDPAPLGSWTAGKVGPTSKKSKAAVSRLQARGAVYRSAANKKRVTYK